MPSPAGMLVRTPLDPRSGHTIMRDLNSTRRFEYRRPRTTTGFSVDFVVGGETLHGLCRNVSDAGIRAEFDGPVPVVVGSFGLLILRHPTRLLKIEAQVDYFEKH